MSVKKLALFLFGVGFLFVLTALNLYQPYLADDQSSLAKTLEMLGDEPLPHKPDLSMKGVSAEKGAELVLKGITTAPKRKKTNKQSNHFVCTSCHNIQREDPVDDEADLWPPAPGQVQGGPLQVARLFE